MNRAPTLGEIIRTYKAASTRTIRQTANLQFAWQRNYKILGKESRIVVRITVGSGRGISHEHRMVRDALLWCAVINYGVLLVWFLFFILARDFMHRLHGRWFQLSRQQFDIIHYAGMGILSLG